jgi:hypothetical protein
VWDTSSPLLQETSPATTGRRTTAILDFTPRNQHGEPAKEVGFTIFRLEGQTMVMETYGLGTVGGQSQPWGYFRLWNTAGAPS